jgi:hypothetical protein
MTKLAVCGLIQVTLGGEMVGVADPRACPPPEAAAASSCGGSCQRVPGLMRSRSVLHFLSAPLIGQSMSQGQAQVQK